MQIQRLFRFPVKGLPAEEITAAQVVRGGGLVGDRAVAFSNGSTEVTDHQWHKWSAFNALKNTTELQQWTLRSHPPHITVTAPGAEPCTFDSGTASGREQATNYFSAQLPAQGSFPRKVIAAEHGMFDSRLSGISLINPRTVAALAQASGTQIDPLRYRGNILLEDLAAFEEFDLIGKVLRIGEAKIAITKSIERCSATSVNPATTEVDLNGPQLLATHFGHLHCGVYGTVLEPGELLAGAKIHIEDSDRRALPLVPAKRTPRFLEVVHSRVVDSDVALLTLSDPHGWVESYDEPGTHLRIHLGADIWRNYTITAVSGDRLSIAVRQLGEASQLMGQLAAGDRVLASGPHGTLTAATALQGHTTMLTAGIGITAGLGLLRGASHAPELAALRVVHVERGAEGELFTELSAAANSLNIPATIMHYDSSRARPSVQELTRVVTGSNNVIICGPEGFVSSSLQACRGAGIDDSRIHREVFISPPKDFGSLLERYPEAQITCGSSGQRFNWRPEAGTLLESLESRGLQPQSSCRSGACGSCALLLKSGAVEYLLEPSARIPENQILTCVAVPLQDLELEI
ncbi:MOSC domain-containing protein [Glutamicibacter uratoxydans]|uniref:MOSC domain-containing protein n=1 Tax=Glutamicibacter uratoxydans TaxID=43667 RepID=UPI003D6FDA98